MGSTRYSAEGTVGRGLSPEIWQAYGFTGGDFGDPSRKPFFFDDFANVPLFTTNTTNIMANGYLSLQTDGVTVQNAAAADNSEGEFGVLEIAGNDLDNNEGYLELGGGKNGLVRLDNTAGERAVVCWEARIKRTTVLDNHAAFAFGLAAPGTSATGALVANNGGLLATGIHFVGFETLAASNEEVDAIYGHLAIATEVKVTDNAGTAVADTWQKYGCIFDPLAASGEKMRYFIDGAEITYDTAVTDAVITAGTAFPTTDEMTLVLLTRVGESVAHPVYMDWWAVGSYSVDT